MSRVLSVFGARFTTGHALWAAVLIPACLLLFAQMHLMWLGITLAVLIGIGAVLTLRGRRVTGWIAALFAWRRRHRQPPPPPSEPAVGATVIPGDHVALRWQGDYVVAAIELVPRPFTPTVIVNGSAFTDDVVDTRTIEELLASYCPDLEADVVSAGYRVGRTAPSALVALYDQVVGPYPAPANRRTWIVLRADPEKTRKSALRRNTGLAGLAQYLMASTTRIADHLASQGIDARPARSFDDFDRATEISFEQEHWSMIKGRSTFTAAYSAPGGPDVWWSARADHTLTRVRIAPGVAPTTTVLLTTLANPSTPRGFSCLFGGQRAALLGESPVSDRHYELPIGSAGILVGETADRYPVYMPFDDVDVSINLGDARLFTQFVVRSAAAGAVVTLSPQFEEFAGYVNARIGQVAKVAWPNATTYLGPHPGGGASDVAQHLHRHAEAQAAADSADQPAGREPVPDGARRRTRMSDEVRVQPSDLTAKANQIRGLTFASPQAQPPLISADALIIASVAVTNIAHNAENLWAYQEFGRLEGLRLAQTLDNVAAAYTQIDQQSGEGIGSTFDVPGGAPGGPVMPKTVDIPAPTHPPKMPIPKGQLASEQGFMDPESTQRALDAGDDGASLRAAATMWRANADTLAASAEKFELNSTDWEGQAADAAYAKFNAYRDWLISLSGSWKRLADEAEVAATAHSKAKSDHEPIAQRYRELSQQVVNNPPPSPAWVDAMNKIAEEQKKSEDLRNTYAREAVVNQIEPEEPPAPVVSGIPVTAEDHKRARPYREGEPGGGGGGQQAPGGGSGGAPQEAPTSPMSAGDPASQAAQAAQQAGQQAGQQGGGSPAGGSPGGGQPGGGQPGGGAPGGGMPGLGKGDPKSPNDPRLRPAAAKGGGGAGAGGGSGGGGLGGVPLQPAVSAETVAPTPYAASAGPAAAGAAGAAGGAVAGGGGMGGMAPMHGAHGTGGSGEKKRNPQLSQDEEIYVEERPHTEPVIGLQARRRPGSEGPRKES